MHEFTPLQTWGFYRIDRRWSPAVFDRLDRQKSGVLPAFSSKKARCEEGWAGGEDSHPKLRVEASVSQARRPPPGLAPVGFSRGYWLSKSSDRIPGWLPPGGAGLPVAPDPRGWKYQGADAPARRLEWSSKNLPKNGRWGLASANCVVYNCVCLRRRSALAQLPARGALIFSNLVVVNRDAPDAAAENVQVASGSITNWGESSEGVSGCHSEVLLRQWIATMPLPVTDETRTAKSCIGTGSWRAIVTRNGRRFSRWRVGLVSETRWSPGFSRSQIPPEGGTPTGTG